MKTKPLSPSQLAVLTELAKPGACAHYMPYMGRFNPKAYYFLSTTMKRCTAQVMALVTLRLAEIFDRTPFGGEHKVRITAAGREALK